MKLKTFCGCLSLKSGVITIGSLTTAFALTAVMSYNVFFGIENTRLYGGSYYISHKIAEAIFMTYSMVIAATSILMIHGARKGDADFMFPWLARSTADLMVVPTLIFTYILMGSMYFREIDPIFFIILAVFIVASALYTYIWLVIYSFYKQLNAEKYSCNGRCNEMKVPNKSLDRYHHI